MKEQKDQTPKFSNLKKFEDKGSKKTAIIIAVCLAIILFLLFYFFFHQYYESMKKIKNLFKDSETEKTEFETNSFSELTSACNNKSFGDSCELNSEFGVCRLSENNKTVCMLEEEQ